MVSVTCFEEAQTGCFSASLLHSSFLAACTQPVEMRETPLGMSDKRIFEMTRSFHVLACHKVCERAVCRLRQGRVKDLQWPKAPGSLPNKLPVALNLQHNTTHHNTPHIAAHMYTRRRACQSHLNEIGSNNTKALFSPSGLILCGCICLLCLCCLD